MTYQQLTRTLSVIILAATCYFLYLAFQLKHAYVYPRFCLFAVLGLSIIVFIVSLHEEKQERAEALAAGHELEKEEIINIGVILTIVVPIVTAMFWHNLSFLVCSIIMMLVLMLYGKCGIVKSILISVVVSAFLQWAFYNQFHVRVPTLPFWPR